MPLVVVRRGIALGLSLVLLVAATALADDLKADADSLTGVQNSVNLGVVEPGSTHGVDVGFVLACKSSNHLTAGATLAIDETSRDIPTGAGLTVTPGQLVVPDPWPVDGAFCTGGEGEATVTPAHLAVTAPTTEGTGYAYSVFFGLSNDETVGNTVAVTVYLDVVAPPPPPPADTTDPVLHGVPADITVITSGDGAVVHWTDPTATDDTDASPSVACDPASGSLFPLGTTTVTCTATDEAGNHATATFTVTVNLDTPPPPTRDLTGTWGRPLGDTFPALVGRAGRTIPLKLNVLDGTAPQSPATMDAPTLTAARLASCASDAAAGVTTHAGTFAWSSGEWQLNLDTSGLGSGCVRLTAAAGDDVIATAVVQLVPDTAGSLKGQGRK
ncbi:MAG TPA: HYR domain-containing protein [Candidatus Limnocylindrales bacterium]|jgi:hypothetical protein